MVTVCRLLHSSTISNHKFCTKLFIKVFSVKTVIISLNKINQLIFVKEKCSILLVRIWLRKLKIFHNNTQIIRMFLIKIT